MAGHPRSRDRPAGPPCTHHPLAIDAPKVKRKNDLEGIHQRSRRSLRADRPRALRQLPRLLLVLQYSGRFAHYAQHVAGCSSRTRSVVCVARHWAGTCVLVPDPPRLHVLRPVYRDFRPPSVRPSSAPAEKVTTARMGVPDDPARGPPRPD